MVICLCVDRLPKMGERRVRCKAERHGDMVEVPEFVLGFFLASLLMTIIAAGYSAVDFNKVFKPGVFGPIAGLRTWALYSVS